MAREAKKFPERFRNRASVTRSNKKNAGKLYTKNSWVSLNGNNAAFLSSWQSKLQVGSCRGLLPSKLFQQIFLFRRE